MQGPLRGVRWIVGTGIHSCWLGTYERAIQAILLDLARPQSVAYDIGAHAGYHTLLLSRAVTHTGHVYAFEPDATNVAALQHHMQMNRASNVTVLSVAVGRRGGTATWAKGSNTYTGRVLARPDHAESGSDRVTLTTIDELVRTATIRPPDLMKIDVEGSEFDVIEGAVKTLSESTPNLLIATHGESLNQLVGGRLQGLGYLVESVDAETLVAIARSHLDS